jgi:hypothetical protein
MSTGKVDLSHHLSVYSKKFHEQDSVDILNYRLGETETILVAMKDPIANVSIGRRQTADESSVYFGQPF